MKRYHIFLLLIVTLAACHEGKQEQNTHTRQASIGQPSEVALIIGHDFSGTDIVDSLEMLLTANVPGLNQGEDFFRLSRIPITMDKGEWHKMHSRVIVKLDPNTQQTTLGTATNVHAQPQVQVLISGPSIDALRNFISTHADQIRQPLLDNQLDMQASYLRSHHSTQLRNDLRKLFHRSIDAPEEVQFTKQGKDFLWGSSRTTEKQLNMVFFTVPLSALNTSKELLSTHSIAPSEDPSEALLTALCQLRDSVLQVNIPGAQPDQWMETVWEEERPIVLQRQCSDSLIELRGLWQMHHGAMGGPFVAHCHLDHQTQTIFWAEGFVYSPSTTKRDLVRRLEASLRTLR